MSDFFENNQEINKHPLADDTVGEAQLQETTDEESTVFSAPIEHKVKSPKNTSKKRFISIIATALSVAILVGGTIAVIKLIPELKEEELASSVFEDITILDRDSSTFTSVSITNTNGEFKFISKQVTTTSDEGQETTTTYWGVQDIDFSKMSTDTMNSIMSSVANITALREIDTKTAEECGLVDPFMRISVEDSSKGNFAFSVGAKSPDGLGYYFMLDGSDKIYVVPTNELSDFQFKLVDLADKTAISAPVFTTDTSANKAEDGSYATFDSITLSGTLFKNTITIENNTDKNSSAEIIPYIITTPTKRYADSTKISPLITLFSKNINVAGNYAFDITSNTLKEFGLDNPDAIVTLTINGESKSFKISVIDDEFCAVIYDGATMIRKVDSSSFEFLSLKAEDFYSNQPFMYAISDVSTMTLVDGKESFKFDISYTEDEEQNRVFHIVANGKEIVASDFQSFYAEFVNIQCSDFNIEDVSGEAVSSIKYNFADGSETTIKFYKVNETQYQYSVDDTPMGKITSAAYKKLIRSIKAQAE